LGDPYVNQLGQGCNLTTTFWLRPYFYKTSEVFFPTRFYNYSCALRGGANVSAWYIHL